MSTYRTYKVYLKSKPDPVMVAADDVDLHDCGQDGCQLHVYFEFYKIEEGDTPNTTIAAFPFDHVDYIVSG